MKKTYYVKAKETKEKFSFFGNYYKIKGLEYRSILCFVPRLKTEVESIDFFKYKFDVVFVMMNPGKSKPILDRYPIKPDLIEALKNLVSAKPDPTQYQIASLAKEMKWESVCIINLSDRKETKSGNFVKELSSLPPSHTIFCNERKEELRLILNQINSRDTIYLAWGQKTQNNFKELAKNAYSKLDSQYTNLIGLEGDKIRHPEHMYLHPLQENQVAKEKWLVDFVKLMMSVER